MVVALSITWLFVWVGLPHLDSAILHNQLSAVMVAIIAGMSGAGGLKKAAQKFGFDLFESPERAAGATAWQNRRSCRGPVCAAINSAILLVLESKVPPPGP